MAIEINFVPSTSFKMFEVDLDKLCRDFASSLTEMLIADPLVGCFPKIFEHLVDIQRANDPLPVLQELFKDGYTMMMLPDLSETLDNIANTSEHYGLRISRDGNHIGLIDSQHLNW